MASAHFKVLQCDMCKKQITRGGLKGTLRLQHIDEAGRVDGARGESYDLCTACISSIGTPAKALLQEATCAFAKAPNSYWADPDDPNHNKFLLGQKPAWVYF